MIMKTRIGEKAIVIGSSISGLLAARALSDYFEIVTIIEKDIIPANGEYRKGVTQARHTHGLLARGAEIIEQFYPGITEELKQKGAPEADLLQDCRWFNEGDYHLRFECGLVGVTVSRLALEEQIRARTLALPNIKVKQNFEVQRLLTKNDPPRVAGVKIQQRETDSREELRADLVVDASGRGSRAPAWLENIGYTRPEEETIKINIGYTTRLYRRDSTQTRDPVGYIVTPTTELPRMGVMLAQEDDRWTVSVGGYMGDYAPTDPEGFLEFARSLPSPDIYNIISQSEPLCDPIAYRFAASQRRYYEKLAKFPDGFLVIGDAICSFNPIYGQGMTVAAQEALLLHECLVGGLDNKLYKRYFNRAGKIVDIPWSLAVGNDLRFPKVEGKRTPMVRFINWYVAKLHKAAHHDPKLALAFHRVTNLLASPQSLLRPDYAFRVWKGQHRSTKTDSQRFMAHSAR
jgi:2-polyprenyl-6-methoxyphenol hydroxylase-like FAD-dependent oxidoreductase